MKNNKQVGYAIRFKETEKTKTHLDILEKCGLVLWGAWKNPTSVSSFANGIKENINNSNNGYDFYAIGQTTVLKMHVIKALSTEEVKKQKITNLIPPYYNINQSVYIWYLIDDIKDYKNRNCLSSLCSISGKTLENVCQIPGSLPWRVFYLENKEEHEVKNIKTYKRNSIPAGLRYDVFCRDGFRCQICGRKISDDPNLILHVDHVIPVSKGGLTTLDNLRTLCQECNLGKSNKIEK